MEVIASNFYPAYLHIWSSRRLTIDNEYNSIKIYLGNHLTIMGAGRVKPMKLHRASHSLPGHGAGALARNPTSLPPVLPPMRTRGSRTLLAGSFICTRPGMMLWPAEKQADHPREKQAMVKLLDKHYIHIKLKQAPDCTFGTVESWGKGGGGK